MIKFFNKIQFNNSLVFELSCFLVVIIAQLVLGIFIQQFGFFNAGHDLRRFAIVLSIMPVAAIYSVLRFVLPPLVSALLVTSIISILSIVNFVKTSLTTIPLSYGDIVNTDNMSIVGHYITPVQILLIIGFLIIIALAFALNPYKKPASYVLLFQVLCLLVALPLSFKPYINKIDKAIGSQFDLYFTKAGSRYVSWSWSANVAENGLPIHLVQTSVSNIPSVPNAAEKQAFNKLLIGDSKTSAIQRPNRIIMILCEGCWNDAKHFMAPFSKLTELGFKPLRAVSPSYGGNTVNASFEVHTGLPAKGVLSGVIYTEYAELLSDHIYSIEQSLKLNGYKNTVQQNNSKMFYKSNVVKPKLGFDEFISRENMAQGSAVSAADEWPKDDILFKSALKTLAEKNTHQFLFLITLYTHGDFKSLNDNGETDYYTRLKQSIGDIADFAKQAISEDPDTLIFLFGDHKPALTKFFYDKNIIPKAQFSLAAKSIDLSNANQGFLFAENASTAIIGDVPAYIYHQDTAKVDDFIQRANNKPLFCVSAALNESFLKVKLPAFEYAKQNHICEDYTAEGYKATVDKYPGWLYSLSLFK